MNKWTRWGVIRQVVLFLWIIGGAASIWLFYTVIDRRTGSFANGTKILYIALQIAYIIFGIIVWIRLKKKEKERK